MLDRLCNYPMHMLVVFAILFCASMFNSSAVVYADTSNFILDFQPNPSDRIEEPEWLNFNCNRGGGGGGFEDCDENDEFRDNNGRDRTAFLMEHLRGDSRGDAYYHVIIGSPGDDFIQESYIRINASFGGGGDDDLGPISDSLGESRDITNGRNNAYDPRGPAVFSGSGTANPKSTLFRQIINDSSGGMTQDFIKAEFNQKHLLSFRLDAEFVDMDFSLDMTNSTFDDPNTPGNMVNTLAITDPEFIGIPNLESDFLPTSVPASDQFDSTVDGDLVDVTGGKYRYVTYGIYEGEGAGFDIFAVDWNDFFDPAQNVGHLYGGSGND